MRGTDPAHVSGMFDDRERGVFVPFDRVHAFGGWTPAVVYSQLAYWHQRMKGKAFYKTAASLAEELVMSDRTVERALVRLRELGVIETVVKKVRNTPTNHFAVNYRRHDELVLAVRQARFDSDNVSETDSDKVAESIDSDKMAESYTGEYLQESTYKHLSAIADAAAKAGPSSPKKGNAPLTGKASARTSSSLPTPLVPPPPPPKLLDELYEVYDAERTSERGSLLRVLARNDGRNKKLLKFIKEAERNDLDPVEVLRVTVRYLARDDYYLGKKGDGKRGLETVLTHVWKYYEAAAAVTPTAGITPRVGEVYSLSEGPVAKRITGRVRITGEVEGEFVPVMHLRKGADEQWHDYQERRVNLKSLRPLTDKGWLDGY